MSNNGRNDKDRDDLINSFFETFSLADEAETKTYSYTSGGSLADLLAGGTDSYSLIETPPELAEKIRRLQLTASSIEGKVLRYAESAFQPEGLKIDYRNSLNERQYLAATTTEGPLLVIAGAGSGKTRTVVYRVGFLIERGVEPEHILLLTFTRKAANEMVNRTIQLLKDQRASKVMGGTFHAFSNYVLRRFAPMLNIPSHFTIIDSPDSEDVIDLIRQELKFEKRSRAFPKKGRIQTIISKARNCNIGIDEVIEREYSGLQEFLEDIEMIAGAFRKYKRLNHLFDYDDLMEFLRDSLRDNLHFRRKVQDLYRYIMVDEFQDTNVVQKEIVDFMAERHRNLMVVGDDTQSIYAFRGANFENILKFPETWKDCQVVKLEQNYRSNQDLLNFTNSIARKAQLGYRKRLFSEITHPWKPVVARFYDHEEEAEFIVGKIMDLRERDVPMDEVAVLYRASYHGNFIQAELLRRNIPYVVVGGIKFVERRHIKDLIAYMRIILNPRDAVAWNRVLKLLPGVGQVTASQIIRDINKEGGELVFERFSGKKYSPELQRLQQSLADAAQPGVTVAGKVDLLIRYYTPILRNLEDDFELRLQDADVLRKLAGKYDELEKFLSDFALDPPSDRFQDSNQPLIDESEDNPVTLSTIHSAKGLEWYAVFVPHLLDGLFPTARALGSIEEVEEERRLFYVACSRAKEQLYLTLPSFHAAWDAYFTLPSRFIAEIEKENYIVNE